MCGIVRRGNRCNKKSTAHGLPISMRHTGNRATATGYRLRMLGLCWDKKTKGLAFLLTLCFFGAVEVNRTLDLLITNQLLYQLSYNGNPAC
jgi:hypothetical protein